MARRVKEKESLLGDPESELPWVVKEREQGYRWTLEAFI